MTSDHILHTYIHILLHISTYVSHLVYQKHTDTSIEKTYSYKNLRVSNFQKN